MTEPEPGSLWRHRRSGSWIRIERVVRRRNSERAMVYFWRISGPEYQHEMTKAVSTAVQSWFLEAYEFAEPAIHTEEDLTESPNSCPY